MSASDLAQASVQGGRPMAILRRTAWLHVPLLVVAGWFVGSILEPIAIPTIPEALAAVAHGVDRGWFLGDLWSTVRLTLVAFAVTTLIGVGIAIPLGLSAFWGDVFEPLLQGAYSVPKVLFYPVVMLFFGVGDATRIAFGIFQSVLPVTLIIYAGMRLVPSMYYEVGAIFGLSRLQLFREIVVPDVLPSVIRALRYGLSLAYLGVVLAEMFASRQGLGSRLMEAMGMGAFDRVFAIAGTLTLVGLAGNGLFMALDHFVGRRWYGAVAESRTGGGVL